MKNKTSQILPVHSVEDLSKITDKVKYINLDITNPNPAVIAYFMENGEGLMYSDIVESTPGYTYVSYDEFFKAESIIDMILR